MKTAEIQKANNYMMCCQNCMCMKQILCFGYSNTYGLIPGTENRYNWEIRWTGRLDAAVRGKGYRVIEEGHKKLAKAIIQKVEGVIGNGR